jgi:hypothetical protein
VLADAVEELLEAVRRRDFRAFLDHGPSISRIWANGKVCGSSAREESILGGAGRAYTDKVWDLTICLYPWAIEARKNAASIRR